MTDIVAFAPVIDPWLVFLGKACIEIGINCRLITLTPDELHSDVDAQDCWKWLSKEKTFRIEIVNASELESICGETCFVLLRGNYQLNDRTLIQRLIKNFTRSVGLLRFAKQSLRWQAKQIVKETIDPYYSLFTEIWTEDLNISIMSKILKKPHRYFGVLLHQRCSILKECCNLLESDIPLGDRPYLFSYAGSANSRREFAANWIEDRLSKEHELMYHGPFIGTKKVIWHYDRAGSQRPRPYDTYIKDIECSWFCLCLPGYTGTTNRVLEAVLRGSIPIFCSEEINHYGLPFRDKSNCILIKNNDWRAGINIIVTMTHGNRLAMQEEVVKLAKSYASVYAISNKLVGNILGKELMK